MYRRRSQGWMKHLDFIMLDLVCLNFAFILAYVIRHGVGLPYANITYRNMAIVMNLIAVMMMLFFDMFKNVLKRGYLAEAGLTVKQVCLVELGSTFYLFAVQEGESYSRIAMYLTGLIYMLLGYGTRILWKSYLKKKMTARGRSTLLVLTVKDRAETVLNNLKNNNYENFRILGVALLDGDKTGEKIAGVRVVASRKDVLEYVCRQYVDEVFVDLPVREARNTMLMEQFTEMGLIVHVKLLDDEQAGNRMQSVDRKQLVESFGNYTVMTTSINYATNRQMFIKRLLDILGGLVGSLITLVLALIFAPIIKLQSPGPIFFVQERVGRNGRRFKMYKFRSMHVDAEKQKTELMAGNRMKDDYMFKLDFDPRIIGCREMPDGRIRKGFGNFIRDWSLDEFPQFFNVLKGDMSLIGTRPPTVEEWKKYELRHMARLAAKPGITGLWQVSGRSNITDFEEVVKLDIKYISEWSFGMDLRILAKTLKVVAERNGAM